VCDFYAATFERLYRELVDPRTTAVETACAAAGAAECVFELRF
jgi:divinyl protochlorophyllide a 8-vinyl-reductase